MIRVREVEQMVQIGFNQMARNQIDKDFCWKY